MEFVRREKAGRRPLNQRRRKAIAQVSFVSKLVGSGFVEENRYRDFGRDSVVGRSYKGYMDVYYGIAALVVDFLPSNPRLLLG